VRPEVTSPEAVMTGNDVTRSHVTGTGSHVTGSDGVRMHNRFPRFFLTIVVQNVPLRMIDMATGSDVIKRHVNLRGSLGRVWCAHAQSGVVQYPPYWSFFTGSDVIKRYLLNFIAKTN
jgi:hypothetical protein